MEAGQQLVAIVSELQANSEELNQKLEDLEHKIEEKDDTLGILRFQASKLETKLNNEKRKFNIADDNNNQLQKQLTQKNDELTKKENYYLTEIKKLQEEIKKTNAPKKKFWWKKGSNPIDDLPEEEVTKLKKEIIELQNRLRANLSSARHLGEFSELALQIVHGRFSALQEVDE